MLLLSSCPEIIAHLCEAHNRQNIKFRSLILNKVTGTLGYRTKRFEYIIPDSYNALAYTYISCMRARINCHSLLHLSIDQSIRLSIYTFDLASVCPSPHVRSHTRVRTQTHTFKSLHPSILSPSVHMRTRRLRQARTHMSTHTHIHVHTCITYFPIAQLAARQICNLTSTQGSRDRTHNRSDNFNGEWS